MDPTPIMVDFPLRGEWVAAHTPAEKVPSHGTDQLGQRYAYDFMRIDRQNKGWKFHHASGQRYRLQGVKLEDCFGWAEPFYAPFDGTIITARDGWPERNPVFLPRELAGVLKNAFFFNPGKTNDWRPVLGNHIILKMTGQEVYAFFAHAKMNSIQVREGEEVHLNQHLANVGHSGNSTAPHLHFHLMDQANMLTAKGLPCSFTAYEALRDGKWVKVTGGIPGLREFI